MQGSVSRFQWEADESSSEHGLSNEAHRPSGQLEFENMLTFHQILLDFTFDSQDLPRVASVPGHSAVVKLSEDLTHRGVCVALES